MPLRAHSLSLALLLLGLCGCAASSDTVDRPDSCAGGDALEDIARAETVFVSAPRDLPGFPSLASSRVLAAFDPLALDERQRAAWLQRLEDAGARRDAILSDALRQRGIEPPPRVVSPPCRVADRLPPAGGDADATAAWQSLAAATQVPDDYRLSRRVLGLYPLAALPVRLGIGDLQDDIAGTFATPLDALPRSGALRRFAPATTPSGVPLRLPPAAHDALGVRVAALPPARLDALFDRHAPILEIDVAGSFDRPGAPAFASGREVSVDPSSPRAYRYARVMALGGELRLQLVYVFWFAERPRSGPFDTLGGLLDGLVWRVTLDRSGVPLVYDAMHPCGCYHMLFPSDRLVRREGVIDQPEPPLLPQAAPRLAADERVVLRLESGTHYLQRVYAGAGTGTGTANGNGSDIATAPAVERYVQHPYRELYSVPSPQGPRSLFGPQGIVPGTQRRERFYLWPMGVRSPGAMRERGRQATAFIGRRHFDDAQLLEELFIVRR